MKSSNRSMLAGAAALMTAAVPNIQGRIGAFPDFAKQHTAKRGRFSRVEDNLKRTQPHLSDVERGELASRVVAGLRGKPAKITPRGT